MSLYIGYDIDSQTTDEILANWKVEDLESGLSHCEWAVGKTNCCKNHKNNTLHVFKKHILKHTIAVWF